MKYPDYHHKPEIRLAAARSARELLQGDILIFDSETDGLHEPEMVQCALINKDRQTLLNVMLRPLRRQTWVEAQAIHGISPEMVAHCPVFDHILPALDCLITDRNLVIYNAGYDWSQILRVHGQGKIKPLSVTCAMELFAEFYGEWNGYRGNYKWQKLQGGDHSALGDCLATLDLLQSMADYATKHDAPIDLGTAAPEVEL